MREEWPLTNRCVDLLEGVIRDINRSAVEAEYERQQRYREYDAISSFAEDREGTTPNEPAPLPAPPLSKPKKRRSFIASLMACVPSLVPRSARPLTHPSRSLVPSSASASAPPATPPRRPPTRPPPTPAPPGEPLACNGIPASWFLLRRARSVLVDAFRRFVLGELGARFRVGPSSALLQPPHFALWVARSTMRLTAEEMARVIEGALQQPHPAPVPEERDEDDRGSTSSTTDGSSVHTPLDFHDAPSPKRTTFRRHAGGPAILGPEAYHTYVVLRALHHRLHDLACRLTAHALAQGHAAAAEAGVAEVRSRRRAWSTRQYLMPGAGTRFGGASMALVGLAVPARPSPLCRGWTAEDIERERRAERRALILRRPRSLWEAHGERHAGAAARSREAEDVDELARDVEGRLAVSDGLGEHESQAGYRETDGDDEDDNDDDIRSDDVYGKNEFGPSPARGTRLVEHPRPTTPSPRPWPRPKLRPKLDMARVAVPKPKSLVVAVIEDNMPVSAKLPFDPDPACAADI